MMRKRRSRDVIGLPRDRTLIRRLFSMRASADCNAMTHRHSALAYARVVSLVFEIIFNPSSP